MLPSIFKEFAASKMIILILHGKEKRNKNCKVKKLIIGTGITFQNY